MVSTDRELVGRASSCLQRGDGPSTASGLVSLLESWQGARVVILGDVMLDRYTFGTCERISPEAPVPVVLFDRTEHMLGGAANVAANVASLGGASTVSGLIGDDDWGRSLGELLRSHAVTHACVVDKARGTTVKDRVMANGQQVVRVDYEAKWPIGLGTEARLWEVCSGHIGSAGAVVISDYGKGGLNESLIQRTLAKAKEAGTPTIVDPKGLDFSRYRGASVLTPNLSEALTALGTDGGAGSPEEICFELRHRAGCDAVVLTLGESGMVVGDADGAQYLPAHKRAVYDITGAGDTVVATMSLVLAAGGDIHEASAAANLAASIAVSQSGTTAVSSDDFRAVASQISI